MYVLILYMYYLPTVVANAVKTLFFKMIYDL